MMSKPASNPVADATGDAENERLADFEQLVWALLDDQISDDDRSRLEQLIASDEQARETYVQCVQMHVDLQDHFAGTTKPAIPPNESKPAKSPVLGFLNQGPPELHAMPPLSGPPRV